MLKWTSEPPTVPGWYFVRTTKTIVVHVERDIDDKLLAWIGPVRQSVKFMTQRLQAQWAGPLEEPKEENDAEMD